MGSEKGIICIQAINMSPNTVSLLISGKVRLDFNR